MSNQDVQVQADPLRTLSLAEVERRTGGQAESPAETGNFAVQKCALS